MHCIGTSNDLRASGGASGCHIRPVAVGLPDGDLTEVPGDPLAADDGPRVGQFEGEERIIGDASSTRLRTGSRDISFATVVLSSGFNLLVLGNPSALLVCSLVLECESECRIVYTRRRDRSCGGRGSSWGLGGALGRS